MRYRAEIDGLRAVAVVPIVLFHAGFGVFTGGFVGVDIFFVISGYLITTIILRELQEGRFTLAGSTNAGRGASCRRCTSSWRSVCRWPGSG